jgi:hypothetical protein
MLRRSFLERIHGPVDRLAARNGVPEFGLADLQLLAEDQRKNPWRDEFVCCK